MMWANNFQSFMGYGAPVWLPLAGLMLIVFMLWSLFWKGLALWHSAQRNEPWWFIALLVINTAGILEIVYLFAVAKCSFSTLFAKRP